MKLAVVVLNWNAAEDTERCLVSVEAWRLPPEHPRPAIWVVDNDSIEPGVRGLKERHPDCHYLLSPFNRGFGGGCNLGIAEALNRPPR